MLNHNNKTSFILSGFLVLECVLIIRPTVHTYCFADDGFSDSMCYWCLNFFFSLGSIIGDPNIPQPILLTGVHTYNSGSHSQALQHWSCTA